MRRYESKNFEQMYRGVDATEPDEQIILMCEADEAQEIPLEIMISQYKYCCMHDGLVREKAILCKALKEIFGEITRLEV